MNEGILKKPDIREGYCSAQLWCFIVSILIQNDGCKCKIQPLERTGILVKMVNRPPLLIMQLFKIIFWDLAEGLMFSDGQCSMESLG